jgi:predicted ArsR family transcriptional regulator
MKIDQVEIRKMHHRNAKETERAAAHKVAQHVRGRRLETLLALHTLQGGGTGEEIAQAAGLSILSIRPRLTELQEMELIEDTTNRRNNAFGNSEIVWRLTEEGRKYVY